MRAKRYFYFNDNMEKILIVEVSGENDFFFLNKMIVDGAN
jgi:hypothetical protein